MRRLFTRRRGEVDLGKQRMALNLIQLLRFLYYLLFKRHVCAERFTRFGDGAQPRTGWRHFSKGFRRFLDDSSVLDALQESRTLNQREHGKNFCKVSD